MSEDEGILGDDGDTQLLTAEYKDGQLQIVEVTPFDKDKCILPELQESDGEQHKYLQVVDPEKGIVQLDLLNLTLVRCSEDGENSYRLVSSAEADVGEELSGDATVTCVLQSDGEDLDAAEQNGHSSLASNMYVMVEEDQGGSLTFLRGVEQETKAEEVKVNQTKVLTPVELIERAQQLQKSKSPPAPPRRTSRKRVGELPPPHELLASPNFKLYLYSCKSCTFKCNAIKELTQHKATAHCGAAKSRAHPITLQCARCPYRGASHTQLMKHVHALHQNKITRVDLNSKSVEEADVLVCGACGFESTARDVFQQHIEIEHGIAP